MKRIFIMALIVQCITGSPCPAQDVVNSEMIFLLISQKCDKTAPDEARNRAGEWDKQILRGLSRFDFESSRASASRHHRSRGADAIVRRYQSPVEMKTYQNDSYWLLSTKKDSLAGVTPLKWVERVLAEKGIRWIRDAPVGNFQVQRCRVKRVVPTDYRQMAALDRSIWLNTLRVLDDEERILVYVEKAYSNRPKIYSHDLELHREWFDDIRNERYLTGQRIHARWWEFWKW